MYLETERMILRDFSLDDIDDFQEIFGDPIVMENTEPPYDREKSLQFLKNFCIEREPKGGFAAVLKETKKVIGYVLFKSIDEPEIYEIGWIFNKNYWRKGYASEICSKLIEHGFSEMKLHKICAEATDVNKSVPLMKKLGMSQEAVFRKHSKSYAGEWLDLHWYAILAEDYIKLKFIAHEFNTLGDYRFADIISVYNGKWVFCRHKERNTWETQGGHIETGETPLEAAKRELHEETGAISFDIEPLCDYWASGLYKGEPLTAHGQVYFATIHELGEIPEDSEMKEICVIDDISDLMTTYPEYMEEIFPIAVKKRKELNLG